MDPFIAGTNPYQFPTNLEESSSKLLNAPHFYGLPQGPNMMNFAVDTPQNTNIDMPAGLNAPVVNDIPPIINENSPVVNNKPPTDNDGNAVYDSNDHVVNALDITQSTTPEILEEEKILDENDITQLEKTSNPEFFIVGKPTKTPEKYKAIRNYILKYWRDHKPDYVNKSVTRKHMVNCGDVTSFGRVHSFLETHGYINVNCVGPAQKPKRVQQPKKPRIPRPRNPDSEFKDSSVKKRKKNHNLEMWNQSQLPADGTRRRRGPPRSSNINGEELDPYYLIGLEDYTEEFQPPFTVNMDCTALVIMDFHAHLVLTEIIGLMGGSFETDENGDQKLTVKCVYPCKSISTDTECEMDPVSEMQAREWFESKGMIAVGWYHSHPKFTALPSIRDIDNQKSYQELFRNKETLAEPFIGVIVSPYEHPNEPSVMAYVHISSHANYERTHLLPYTCHQSMTNEPLDVETTLDFLNKVVEQHKYEQEKMDMSSKIDGLSVADKCLASLDRFIQLEPETRKDFLSQARRLLLEDFRLLH